MEKFVERRKDQRLKASDRAFVIHGPYFTRRSQIIDISRGGLAFRHVGGEERLRGLSQLDILFAEGSFYLGKIPVKTVSDNKADPSAFDSIAMRRHSVQFEKLTQGQVSHLEYFMRNHARVEGEPEKKA